MRPLPSLAAVLALVLSTCSLAAAEPAEAGAPLRAALRDALLQLRSAQAEQAGAQAALAAATEERKILAEKFDAFKKQVVAERTVADQAAAALTAQVAEQKTTVARLGAELAKARQDGEKSAQAARAQEAEATRLAGEKLVLERRIAERERQNLALFQTANEILRRYEEFGLGTALRAKEPFVGLTRTKLENQVQGYQDKLLDQRLPR